MKYLWNKIIWIESPSIEIKFGVHYRWYIRVDLFHK